MGAMECYRMDLHVYARLVSQVAYLLCPCDFTPGGPWRILILVRQRGYRMMVGVSNIVGKPWKARRASDETRKTYERGGVASEEGIIGPN